MFSRTILPLFLIKSGLTFPDLALGAFLNIFAQICGVLLLSKFNLKNKHIWLGSGILFMSVFLLQVFIPILPIYLITTLLAGLASVTFYGTYNVSHFELTPRNKTGSGAAIFFNMLTGVGIVAPLAAGIVATLSIYSLIGLSTIFLLIAFYFLRFQEEVTIHFSLKESLQEIRGVWPLVFLRGIHEALGTVILLITLTLFKEFFDLGLYGTMIAGLGIIISQIIGKKSDALTSKKNLLVPLAVVNGILTLLYALDIFQTNILLWAILNLVVGKFDGIFDQTSIAFVMDETADRLKATFGRELVLNIGRLLGNAAVIIGFIFPTLLPLVITFLAATMLIYALVAWRMKHRHQIL